MTKWNRSGKFLALFLLAIVVRTTAVLLTDFDGLYGQDAFAYYENAKLIQQTFPDLEGIRRDYWPAGKAAPIGYPAAVALFLTLLGSSPLAGQVLSMLAGSFVPPLLFLLTLAMLAHADWPERDKDLAGIFAGLLAIFSGALIRSSLVVMADALGLSLATLSALLAVRYSESGRLAIIALLALSMGLAILVRNPNATLALATCAYIFFSMRERSGLRLTHIMIGVGIGIVLLLPQVLLALGDRPTMVSESALAMWNPLNAFRSSFVTANGSQSHLLPNFLFYLAPVVHPASLGPLVLPAVVLGIVQLMKLPSKNGVLLLGGWLLMFYVILIGTPFQNFRYTESYFPPLAIAAGIGFVAALRNVPTGRVSLTAWVAVTFASMWIFGYLHVQKFVQRKAVELQVTQWVAAHCSSDMKVLSFAVTPSIRHYLGLDAKELYYQDTTSLNSLLHSGQTLFVADFSYVETQWRNTRVFDLVEWIREHYAMEKAGEILPYRAYVIKERL